MRDSCVSGPCSSSDVVDTLIGVDLSEGMLESALDKGGLLPY